MRTMAPYPQFYTASMKPFAFSVSIHSSLSSTIILKLFIAPAYVMIREATSDTSVTADGLLPSSGTLAIPKGMQVTLDVICACTSI